MEARERRLVTAARLELRAADAEGKPPVITGYAALFDTLSEDLGGFREKIQPGAFTRALPTADVVAVINHEPWPILGRTTAGTLTLREDARGLAFEIAPPDTQTARDLVAAIERGDMNGCSFLFSARVDQWDTSGITPIRTLVDVDLFDVSFATNPAYRFDAALAMRSLDHWRQEHPAPPVPTPRRDRLDALLAQLNA